MAEVTTYRGRIEYKIEAYSLYQPGMSGFVIAAPSLVWEDHWIVPAWEECGLADLAGVFPTIKAAHAAISKLSGA